MTTKSPEQEAGEYAYDNKKFEGPYGEYDNYDVLYKAHLAGQKVGYLIALEEVIVGAYSEGQAIDQKSDTQWVRIEDLEKVINNLKAKAGKE